MGIGLPLAGRRHVATGIVIPVVLSLLAMAATVGGFVLWSTGNSDARAVQRQTALIDHTMRGYIQMQADNQTDYTIWDEAVANTSGTLDLDWVDENLGTYFYQTHNYEQAAVLDASDTPIYMMSEGKAVDPSTLGDDMAGIAPLVDRLRADLASGALRAFFAGARHAPYVADYVTIAGTPALVTVAPIAAKAGRGIVKPGHEFIHVAIDFLDDTYATYLGDATLVENASFRQTQTDNPEDAAFPLLNSAGRIITFFEWRQDWPGRRLLWETVPVLGGALLLVGLLVLALVNRVVRYSTALEAGRQKAEHHANHDALTGLPNRAFFETRLAALSAEPRVGKVALFMLDLDRFKQVNDTLGHPAGDELIRIVGARLRHSLSASGFIARLGGDEFAVIEPTIASAEDAMALANRMVEIIDQPFDLSGNEASVGVSIGIGLAGTSAITPTEHVRRADIALYQAKASGRNRAVVYEPSMDVAVQQRHALEADLRDALRTPGQIDVVFEPIIDGATGRVAGAEALPRWRHPQLGDVPRETFLAVAETSRLSEPLGERVLEAACRLGARHPNRVVSVNVSLAQILNPRFFSRVFDILAATGQRASGLELEITETVLVKGGDAAAEVLRKLQATGIRVALDDFGTGYSSLTFLKQHDVDHIKIDRAFAQDAGDDRSSLAIVQAMVDLAHAINIKVTAKGIDTTLQRTRFTGIGCDRFQGALISPPMEIEAISEALGGDGKLAVRADAA